MLNVVLDLNFVAFVLSNLSLSGVFIFKDNSDQTENRKIIKTKMSADG